MGTIAGFLVGAGAGAALGYWSDSDGYMFSKGAAAGLGALLGGVSGLFVGAVVGSFVETEEWQPVLVWDVTCQQTGR